MAVDRAASRWRRQVLLEVVVNDSVDRIKYDSIRIIFCWQQRSESDGSVMTDRCYALLPSRFYLAGGTAALA